MMPGDVSHCGGDKQTVRRAGPLGTETFLPKSIMSEVIQFSALLIHQADSI